jgi:tRNA pseudouridine55 synthase
MRARRGATRLCGIIAVDKPAGMTSHDVVAAVRRASGEGRVGHAGTLDPLATGLLVVLVGAYTRLEPYLSGAAKTYEARIRFGSETDTDDAEGVATALASVPPGIFERDRAQKLLDGLLGDSLQNPPAYSSIKVGGRISHRVARGGGTLALEPRPITVDLALLEDADPAAETWDVLFQVSKGTYVRALARDIGRVAGTRAHLAGLRRTASGALDIRAAHTLDDIVAAAAEGGLPTLFTDPFAATGLRRVAADTATVEVGGPLPHALEPALADGDAVGVEVGGRLAAVYRVDGDQLRAEAVFPEAGA